MHKRIYAVICVLLTSYACTSSLGTAAPAGRETPAELLADVQGNLDPDTAIPSKPDNTAKIDDWGAVSGLDGHTAKLKKKHWYTSSKHKWVALIYASEAYPRMHLAKGENYVFLVDNPTDAAHAFVLVPGDASQPYFLLLSSADLAHGNPGHPLLVRKQVRSGRPDSFVLGACIECPPLGHCSATDVGDAY